MELFSVVFQDLKLFSYSVQENITMSNSTNTEKFNNCIELVDLGAKVSSLEDGVSIYMSKQFANNGVEVSGGEGQK